MKIIIIGSGIAGLSTGCYLQMNGYETEIYEMNPVPGGLCTSWKRGEFIFDGCLHWLVGSNPADPYYRIWMELMDMKKLQFVDPDIFFKIEDSAGNFINVYTNLDRLEAEFLSKAPEDSKLIREYVSAVKKLSGMTMDNEKPEELYSVWDGIRMLFKTLPYYPAFSKYLKISARDWAARCRNPLLRRTFLNMFVPEMSVVFLMFTSAWFHKRSAGYPIGGSTAFIDKIVKRYLALGGKIHFNSRVVRILTEPYGNIHRTSGIVLENGESHYAERVISASDGYTTIFNLLEGRFTDKTIRGYYENLKPFSSYLQISLGIGHELDETVSVIGFPIDPPLIIDPETTIDEIGVRIFNFDPTMAPPGKTVLTVFLPTCKDAYWVDLRNNDKKKYGAEKERIAKEVIGHLDKRFGSIGPFVEEIDVATPATVIRYSGNWHGSFEGWLLTPKTGWHSMKKTLPGLINFYMVGHWVMPGGGLPAGALSGRGVAQIICRQDNKTFTPFAVE